MLWLRLGSGSHCWMLFIVGCGPGKHQLGGLTRITPFDVVAMVFGTLVLGPSLPGPIKLASALGVIFAYASVVGLEAATIVSGVRAQMSQKSSGVVPVAVSRQADSQCREECWTAPWSEDVV